MLESLGLSPNDRESPDYLNRIRPREYESLMAAMAENLDCGNSAILTAPFIREFGDDAWVNRVRAANTDAGAQTSLVWVHCDPATMHTYIRHRGAARDNAKLTDWSGYLRSIDVDFRPSPPFDLIDNSASSIPLQSQAMDLLKAVLGGHAT